MRRLWTLLMMIAVLGAQAARAQSSSDFTPPCRGEVWWADSDATFEDFDFWLGTWQVFDADSGELMGFDEITKEFDGCALRQHWRQLNDRFALPGSPRRYEGGSFTGLDTGGRWRQTWHDVAGSNIPLFGGLDADGVMTLESNWLEFRNRSGDPVKVRYRWHWKPEDANTIHNWGWVERAGSTDGDAQNPGWQKYFDIVYRRNSPGGPQAEAIASSE